MRHFKLIHLNSRDAVPPYTKREASKTSAPWKNAAPTSRELQIEDLLCRGYSQENIAAIFGRSINTISTHVQSLYRKRGVHTQVGLLLAYLERKHIFVFRDEGVNRGSNPYASAEAVQ